MPIITDWIMVIITAVYVIATIFICIFNYKSANASKKQIDESKRQYEQSNRPHIVAGIKIISDSFMCISIQNIGNDVADNITIKINDEWLELIKDSYYLEPLKELMIKPFMLIPQQEIIRAFTYVIIGTGNTWLDVFNDKPLIVDVSYRKKNTDIIYNDKFVYDIKLFRNMFREKDENEGEIKNIGKILKTIATSSEKISSNTKTISDRLKK